MGRREKLLRRLLALDANFAWDDAVALMNAYGFRLLSSGGGSSRKFLHDSTKVKVFIHEPHPQPTLKRYAMENLIEGLRNAGEIE